MMELKAGKEDQAVHDGSFNSFQFGNDLMVVDNCSSESNGMKLDRVYNKASKSSEEITGGVDQYGSGTALFKVSELEVFRVSTE